MLKISAICLYFEKEGGKQSVSRGRGHIHIGLKIVYTCTIHLYSIGNNVKHI